MKFFGSLFRSHSLGANPHVRHDTTGSRGLTPPRFWRLGFLQCKRRLKSANRTRGVQVKRNLNALRLPNFSLASASSLRAPTEGLLVAGSVGIGSYALLGSVYTRLNSAKAGANNDDPWSFIYDKRRETTNMLMGLNLACFLLQVATRGRLMNWGAKVNVAIAKGEIWRLLTASVLHVNVLHLLVNAYSLHNVGPSLEAVSGQPRMLASYVTGAFMGNLLSYHMCPSPAVGASGAIIGLAGGLAVYHYRHRHLTGPRGQMVVKRLQKVIVLNMLLGLAMHKMVDNWGHLGGLLGGSVAAWWLGPNLTRKGLGGYGVLVDESPWRKWKAKAALRS
mmetsp:Transcript_28341/g.47555  ORF Transcript_28341/g.47555 Transcript_28341/m.47555 type:complete len:334 (-) Transcript_28341:288-1289(-)